MIPFQDAYRKATDELEHNVKELRTMVATEQAHLSNATRRVSAMTFAVEQMQSRVEESSGAAMAMGRQLRRFAIAILVFATATTLLAATLVVLTISS
jgi:hypothetical protein